MKKTHEVAVIRGEPISHHAGRSLTAWLSSEEAATALLGRTPGADDDLRAIRKRIKSARDALAGRPVLRPRSAVLDVTDRSELDAAAERKDIHAAFAAVDWSIEMVDLLAVQALQKTIRTEKLAERVARVLEDPAQLMEFCLPSEEQADPPLGTFTDVDRRGFAISSINPNLRITGTNVSTTHLSTPAGPVPVQAITFFINFGTSFINIAQLGERFLLRDGYHRVVALLRAGITRIPAVIVKVDEAEIEEVLPGAQTFGPEVSLGDRPPLVGDFFDPLVSDEIAQPATRKVLRIRGEEFFVQE